MFFDANAWPPPPNGPEPPPPPPPPRLDPAQERTLMRLVIFLLVALFVGPFAGSSVIHAIIALLR